MAAPLSNYPPKPEKVTAQPTHDRVQSECFLWAWNNHPEIRPLLFAVPNEMILLGLLPKAIKIRFISFMKSIGLVKGVWDLLFYWKGVLYGFDIKLPGDSLSKEQSLFAQKVIENGGKCYEIADLSQFQRIFKQIMSNNAL